MKENECIAYPCNWTNYHYIGAKVYENSSLIDSPSSLLKPYSQKRLRIYGF
jgi:hypothetical protein